GRRAALAGTARAGEHGAAGGSRAAAGAARHPKKIAGHPLRTAAERFAQIKILSGDYEVEQHCHELEVSRSGYYDWCRRQRQPGKRASEEAELRVQIRRVHHENEGVYGSPRIARELRQQGVICGRHRVARLMRADGVFGRQRRRFRVGTTDSNHSHPIAPNRLAELGPPTKANQIWVSDITYVETTSG